MINELVRQLEGAGLSLQGQTSRVQITRRRRVATSFGALSIIFAGLITIFSRIQSDKARFLPTIGFKSTATQTSAPQKTKSTNINDIVLLYQKSAFWPVFFLDDFELANKGWFVGEDNDEFANALLSISGGEYEWDITSKDSFFWRQAPISDEVADFRATVTAQLANSSNDGSYGVSFRETPEHHSYMFELSNNRQYSFSIYFNDEVETLINWTDHPSIYENQNNEIVVIAEGDHFLFFINGQYVDGYYDKRLPLGFAGVMISMGEPNQHAVFLFDEFEIQTPEPSGIVASNGLPTQTVTLTPTLLQTPLPTSSPTITYTPSPTPTPTPSIPQSADEFFPHGKEVEDWPIIFSDAFSSTANDWPTGVETIDGITLTRSISNNSYRIDPSLGKSYGINTIAPQPPKDNFAVSIEASMQGGIHYSSYGIVFNYQDDQNYFVFEIMESGQYRISLVLDGERNFITSWIRNQYVKLQDSNRLSVYRIDTKYFFEINTQIVYFINEELFLDGKSGFYVSSSAGEATKFTLHEIVVQAPE